jgi:hypothetical protein
MKVLKRNVWVVMLVFATSFCALLNMEVVTKVGEGQRNLEYKIPVYLKVLNFYDRHYNYAWLVRRLTGELENDEEKIIKLLAWIVSNIKKQPESLPVIDDHVWSVIVRRYGNMGNLNDVFSTLCNYAGVDAFFEVIETDKVYAVVTLARINHRWTVIDPSNGAYFRNNKGELATIEEMKRGDFNVIRVANRNNWNIDYGLMSEGLSKNISFGRLGIGRANIQSPTNRFLYQLNQWVLGE